MPKAKASRDLPAIFPDPDHDHDRCSTDAMAVAEALCLERGQRLTPIRRKVLAALLGSHKPLVMAVNGDSQHSLGRFLANDVLVELRQDLARRGDSRKELLARAAAFAFLVEDTLAKLDALAADVNVARSFDQWSDVPITFATERTERILFGCAAAACSAADVPARWHSKLLPGRQRSYAMAREKRMVALVCPMVSVARS